MSDIMSREERSKRMSLIRSKWTKPEKWLHNHLKGNKIKHKMHPAMKGSPDIIIPKNNIAIFLHGCFWHACKKCYRKPVNNKEFWENKIIKSVERDRKNKRLLKKDGWNVRVLWECKIPRNKPDNAIREILKDIL